MDVTQSYIGETISVSGQFRSYNRHEEKKNRLILFRICTRIRVRGMRLRMISRAMQISPSTVTCVKSGTVQKSTAWQSRLRDLLVAVNGSYGKSDYIPCICWGRNARYASSFEVGSRVGVYGRIQSREYIKKIGEEQTEKRVAYEVSVNKIEFLE